MAGADSNVVAMDVCELLPEIEEARSARLMTDIFYRFAVGVAIRLISTSTPSELQLAPPSRPGQSTPTPTPTPFTIPTPSLPNPSSPFPRYLYFIHPLITPLSSSHHTSRHTSHHTSHHTLFTSHHTSLSPFYPQGQHKPSTSLLFKQISPCKGWG